MRSWLVFIIVTAPISAAAQDAGVAYDPEQVVDQRVDVVDPSNNAYPDIAHGAGQYFAAWSDSRASTQDVFGARIDSNGRVIDRDGVAIHVSQDRVTNIATAFDGTNYAVVWRNADARDAVQMKRVSSAGVVLTPNPIAIGQVLSGAANIACEAGQCLVAWGGFTGIEAKRIDAQDNLLDAMAISLSTSSRVTIPAMAAADGGYVLAWSDSSMAPARVFVARIGADGSASTPVVVSGAASGYSPQLARAGQQMLVVWGDNPNLPRALSAVRIGLNAQPIDAQPIAIHSGANAVSGLTVAGRGAEFLVAWNMNDHTNDTSEMFSVRVSAAGALSGTAASLGQVSWIRNAGQVASSGADFMLVWDDFRSEDIGNHDIFGSRLDANGDNLDGDGFIVSLSPSDQAEPDVAFGGGQYLAVWEDLRTGYHFNAYAIRLATNGAPIDSSAFALAPSSEAQRHVRVAFDGTQFLAVWQQGRPSRIRAARISGAGAVLDVGGFVVSPAGMTATEPDVAFANGTFLVAWTEVSTLIATGNNILGARVSSNGQVIDTTPIAISAGRSDQGAVDLAANGAAFFAAWQDSRFGISRQVFATRIDGAGSVLDPTGIHLAARPNVNTTGMNDWHVSVAAAGNQWIATWHTQSPRESTVATRVSSTGVVVDQPFVTVEGTLEGYPAVAEGFGGHIVAWPSRGWQAPREMRFATLATNATPTALPPISGSVRSLAIAMRSGREGLLVYDTEEVPGQHRLGRIRARVIRGCMGADCDSPPDAGFVDAVVPDASSIDVGAASDTDAGVIDAGSIDAEPVMDATTMDAGIDDVKTATTARDAGLRPLHPPRKDDCSCSATSATASRTSGAALWFLIMVVCLITRRKPRNQSADIGAGNTN